MKRKPFKKWKMLGIWYKIKCYKRAGEVDTDDRDLLDGEIHFDNETIRIHYNPKKHSLFKFWQAHFHEIIEGTVKRLKLTSLMTEKGHDDIDRLATELTIQFDENGIL